MPTRVGTASEITARLAKARKQFDTGDLARLVAELPDLIATAHVAAEQDQDPAAFTGEVHRHQRTVRREAFRDRPADPPVAPGSMATGRPRGFDHDTALVQALEEFWRYGYEATSIATLTAAMGIRPPSLYAAFAIRVLGEPTSSVQIAPPALVLLVDHS